MYAADDNISACLSRFAFEIAYLATSTVMTLIIPCDLIRNAYDYRFSFFPSCFCGERGGDPSFLGELNRTPMFFNCSSSLSISNKSSHWSEIELFDDVKPSNIMSAIFQQQSDWVMTFQNSNLHTWYNLYVPPLWNWHCFLSSFVSRDFSWNSKFVHLSWQYQIGIGRIGWTTFWKCAFYVAKRPTVSDHDGLSRPSFDYILQCIPEQQFFIFCSLLV